MTSSWLPRLSALLAPAVCLTLQAASVSADACAADSATRWLPQRSWPSACEPDAVTDGLVLLDGDALPASTPGGDGELRVTVDRIVAGQSVETFKGKVSHPDATSALFQSDKPLAPQTDYQISAVHVAADGTVLGSKFTSAFTTGVRTLAPLSFSTAPSMNYEEAETERYDCVADACGKQNCQPGDEMVHIKSVRIAVPAIVGGVDLKPYAVTAQLVASFTSGQAPAVATSDTVATQAGRRSFLVLELPALPTTAQGCVTISATDVAGHTLKSDPVCTSLPADDAPYDDDVQGSASLNELSLTQSAQASTASGLDSTEAPTAVEASAAQGCAVGQSRASLGTLGWLAVALTFARIRSSKHASRKAQSSRRRDDHADKRA